MKVEALTVDSLGSLTDQMTTSSKFWDKKNDTV